MTTDLPKIRFIRQRDLRPSHPWPGVHPHGKKFRANITRAGKRTYRDFDTKEEAIQCRRQWLAQAPRRRRAQSKTIWTNTGLRNISDTIKWIGGQPMHCFQIRHKLIYYGPKSRTRAKALQMAKHLIGAN